MRIPRIYMPVSLTTGETIELDENAFNHAVRVLRLKEDVQIILFNGQGGEYEARLCDVTRKSASATIGKHIARESESPLWIILGQCISRGEKMDYTIQKAVELGVNEIVPLFSERCNVKLQGDRLEKKIQHWQAVVISACEQSGRNRVPGVTTAFDYDNWITTVAADTKLILDPAADMSLSQIETPGNTIALVMGPEGGFDEKEIQLAKQSGFKGVRLGGRILRTETAALTTLSAIQTLWGDLAS